MPCIMKDIAFALQKSLFALPRLSLIYSFSLIFLAKACPAALILSWKKTMFLQWVG